MVYVALIILLGLLAASHFSNRDLLKECREVNPADNYARHEVSRLEADVRHLRGYVVLVQQNMAEELKRESSVVKEAVNKYYKANAEINDNYHTKLFKALGGTIMRSDPDAEGFGHIEFRLSDRSTCNMYDKVDDAGVERQCKSMLDNLLPGVARGLDLMDHRLKLIEESKETKTKK